MIPESEYEAPWYPTGTPCEHAVPMTKPQTVQVEGQDSNMQSFSFQQLVEDAKALEQQMELEQQNTNVLPPAPALPEVLPPPVPTSEPPAAMPPPPPASSE